MKKIILGLLLGFLCVSAFAFKSYNINGTPMHITANPDVKPTMIIEPTESMRPFMCRFYGSQPGAYIYIHQYNFKYGWTTKIIALSTTQQYSAKVYFDLDHDVATKEQVKYLEFTTCSPSVFAECYFTNSRL